MTNAFIVLHTNTLARGEKCALGYSHEQFSVGDKRDEGAFKLPSQTATHVATNDFQAELFWKLLLPGILVSRSQTVRSHSARLQAFIFEDGR